MSHENLMKSRRWFEESWNRRQTDVVDEILAPECVGHMETGEVVGIEAFKNVRSEFLAMFPDLSFEIDRIVAEGDDVAIRWTASGTHTGDGMGLKATTQPVTFRGTTWHRYQNGKLVEGWDFWNEGALLQALHATA